MMSQLMKYDNSIKTWVFAELLKYFEKIMKEPLLKIQKSK